MARRVFVVGNGMTKFEKPGAKDWDYPDMAKEAITRALADAGLPWSAVQQACVGYVYGDSTCGQRAVYTMGPTGIPVYNVNNNCSTGSTALFMARQFIQGGLADCVLALGFEKMKKGSLVSQFDDRTNPLDQHVAVMVETHGIAPAPMAPQMFGNAGREHMKLYGTKPEHFGKIAEKNHRHSANNPYSQFQDIYTLEQIMASKKVHEPITMLQACPTSDGAGAAILCSESFVLKYGLQKTAIEIAGMQLTTDFNSSFTENSMIKAVGFDMTKAAAAEAFKQAGMTVNDVQVVELHDCFSCNELITYEALGLCPIGKAGEFIDRGDNTYGGKYVVNPSGGLISKGHPLGATGLAQCAELCWQLRGLADKRQVKNVTGALQHNLGLGGAAVVGVYRRPNWNGVTVTSITTPSRADSLVAPKPIEPSEKLPTAVNTNGPKVDAPKSEAPKQAAASSSSSSSSSSTSTKQAPAGSLKAESVFNEMGKTITPDLVKKVNVIYRFDITGPSGSKSWLVDLKNGAGGIKECDETAKADCTIIIKDDDLVLLMAGKLNAQQAFMKGQIKLKGNLMLAQKLQALTQPKSKL